MDFRTPLAKVRGLGSAHNGVSHWWMQRLTAIVLAPLCFWLVIYAKQLATVSQPQMTVWLAEPVNSFCAIAWMVVAFYHAALGLQVVIEDYVHQQWQKITLIWVVKMGCFGLALATVLAVLRIIFQVS